MLDLFVVRTINYIPVSLLLREIKIPLQLAFDVCDMSDSLNDSNKIVISGTYALFIWLMFTLEKKILLFLLCLEVTQRK